MSLQEDKRWRYDINLARFDLGRAAEELRGCEQYLILAQAEGGITAQTMYERDEVERLIARCERLNRRLGRRLPSPDAAV